MSRIYVLIVAASILTGCSYTFGWQPNSVTAPMPVTAPVSNPTPTAIDHDSTKYLALQTPWTQIAAPAPNPRVSTYTGPWKAGDVINVILTAYSSDPEHTDDTPHITAWNTRTRWGIIANNSLPFGTRVRFPEVFGQEIFTVEDRMASRYDYRHADVWWPSHAGAHAFPTRRGTPMEIVSLP